MNTNENAKTLNDDELVSVVGGVQRTVDTQSIGKAIVRAQPTVGSGVQALLANGTIVDRIDGIPPCKDPYSNWIYVKIGYTNEEGKHCEGWIAKSFVERYL